MALTLIYKPTLAKIDTIELDASISESHMGEVEITEHPVEQGANVSDHARPKPDILTIEGMVSNTPVNRSQNQRKIESQGFQLTSATNADSIVGQPGVAETAYTKLLALKDSGKLITVATKLRAYQNMILKSLTVPRDSKTGDVLRFQATFQRIRIAQNKAVDLPIKEPQHKPKTNKGKKPSKPTDNPEPYRSAAKTLTDSAGWTKPGSGVTP